MSKKHPRTTRASSHLLKDKNRIYPDVLTSEYLEELLTFSRVATQGYAVCICNIPKFRDDLMSLLAEKLKPDGIGFHTVRLSENEQSLGRIIRILLESDDFLKFKKNYKKVALSVIGLDNAILEDEKKFDKRPTALQGINQQRDYLRTLPFPLFIWVPEWLAAKLPAFAPDFWVAKSVVFECLGTSEMINQSLSQLSGAEIEFDNLDQAKRKIRIYEKLIKVSEDRRTKSNFIMNLGVIHHKLGNYREAQKLYLQSLEISEELGDKSGIARTLHQLGMIHQEQGNYAEAVKKYEESLKIAEELGNKSGIAATLHQLGNIHYRQGNYAEAVKKYEQSLKITKELRDKKGIAYTLGQLGNVHYDQGNYPEAQKNYEEVLKLSIELGDRSSISITFHQLGMIHQDQGNYKEAVKKYEQSLKIKQELGDKSGIASTLHQLGMINEEQKDYREAMRKYLTAFSIFKELGSPNAKIAEESLARLREKMGEKAFEKTWKEIMGKDSSE